MQPRIASRSSASQTHFGLMTAGAGNNSGGTVYDPADPPDNSRPGTNNVARPKRDCRSYRHLRRMPARRSIG